MRDNLVNTRIEFIGIEIMDTQTPSSEGLAPSTLHQQIKSVSSRHRALMWRIAIGQKPQEVAVELGFSPTRVSQIINSPLFVEELRELQEMLGKQVVQDESTKLHGDQVRATLSKEALNSLNVLVGLRDNGESERVRQLSAIEILNKAGYKEGERIEADVRIDASEGLVNAIQCAVLEKNTSKQLVEDGDEPTK